MRVNPGAIAGALCTFPNVSSTVPQARFVRCASLSSLLLWRGPAAGLAVLQAALKLTVAASAGGILRRVLDGQWEALPERVDGEQTLGGDKLMRAGHVNALVPATHLHAEVIVGLCGRGRMLTSLTP